MPGVQIVARGAFLDIVEGEERGETGEKVRILLLLNEICDTV